MAKLLDIKTYPESILRVKCQPVKDITGWEKRLVEDMLYTMYNFKGIGLAAPQVGISSRIIVVDVEGKKFKLVNPMILEREGSSKMVEGCLSLPGVEVEVDRAERVFVKAWDTNGKELEIEAEGLLARVLQHEIDHLEGTLLIDYMNFFQRLIFGRNTKRR